jgi:hypothetical protein
LIKAFAADANDIASLIGRRAVEELLTAHRLWSAWLREGRVRKIAAVAAKIETPGTTATNVAVSHHDTNSPGRDHVTRRLELGQSSKGSRPAR